MMLNIIESFQENDTDLANAEIVALKKKTSEFELQIKALKEENSKIRLDRGGNGMLGLGMNNPEFAIDHFGSSVNDRGTVILGAAA